MEKDLRASLVAAGAAAALSALVGIIAGVGFFILFLRAVVGGLLLGAASTAGSSSCERPFPASSDPGEAPRRRLRAVDAPEMGANVDIVLPGEAAIAPRPRCPRGELAPSRFAEARSSRDSAKRGSEPRTAGLDALEEASLLEPEGEAAGSSRRYLPSTRTRKGSGALRGGFDELDVLPDLDGFTDSFTGLGIRLRRARRPSAPTGARLR